MVNDNKLIIAVIILVMFIPWLLNPCTIITTCEMKEQDLMVKELERLMDESIAALRELELTIQGIIQRDTNVSTNIIV